MDRSTVDGMLDALRALPGKRLTIGLPEDVVSRFREIDPSLDAAIRNAFARYTELAETHPELIEIDEVEQITRVQSHIVNFYGRALVNPYVALGAAGPWIVTLKGAVIHDSGGYGMLGQGHTPKHVLDALSRPQVMANVMTPNPSQLQLVGALRKEIGHTPSA